MKNGYILEKSALLMKLNFYNTKLLIRHFSIEDLLVSNENNYEMIQYLLMRQIILF